MVATFGSLEAVELDDDAQEDTECIVDPSIVDPLFKLSHLKHVKLHFHPNVTFTDADYDKTAQDVKSLDIRFYGETDEPIAMIASLEAIDGDYGMKKIANGTKSMRCESGTTTQSE
ncbi:hypothetical protein C0991_000985 [Blastosporella zonata]|nr:hypothetical protein C0991_000985 [Blastosporella zonata]